MKVIIMRVKYLLLLSPFFFRCSGEDKIDCTIQNDQIVTLANGDNLTTPACWVHEARQGINSYPGVISYEGDSIYIMYDIGDMAGNFVEHYGTDILSDSSFNEAFIYTVVNGIDSTYENCCVLFTFPDRGPANFVLFTGEKIDEVLPVIKTYKLN